MKKESTDARLTKISTATTQKLPAVTGREASQARKLEKPERGKLHVVKLLLIGLLVFGCLLVAAYPLLIRPFILGRSGSKKTVTHHVIVKPFDPNVGAILPTHRIVAYYGIPN